MWYGLVAVFMLVYGGNAMAQSADIFTIYVTRHAEKVPDQSDPQLSAKGRQRAHHLAQLLQYTQLKQIFATKYRRAQETAEPTAKLFDLTISTYGAGDAEQLAQGILSARQNALVVGHSNTVPALVKLLGGHEFELTERDYGDVFMLQFRDGELVVTRLVVPLQH
ncbi:SixA phosphatase family protein [Pseudidiomarina andamanensis]|uniref:Histidine phosphatase family protein n=1 Tax=Pseudidiomarina andamanensis TaxID=1940690 RepID=A0AA92EUI7_9GAMM|nr:histidine phosphatase family protein [Pseudidiomarina andamanensis]MDS0218604.1 histidine phosphatase family protein [Pseudidiomarina andamanensis]QGT95470.1 histidine phosphatase family protein [Pseudidiomarina andamanensis]